MDFSVLHNDVTYLLWGTFPDGPLAGAALTVAMSLAAGLGALVVGLIGGIAQVMVKGWAMRLLSLLFVFLRSIPVIMLFFWTFFLFPMLFGKHVSGVTTVILSLAAIYAAYIAQVVRTGLLAVDREQWQGGLSLGLTRRQTLRFIILPQALRMMTPSFLNQGIALIKDTSLAYILSVNELTMLATQVNGRLMVHATEVFLFSGLIYLLLCGSLEIVAALLRRRLERGGYHLV